MCRREVAAIVWGMRRSGCSKFEMVSGVCVIVWGRGRRKREGCSGSSRVVLGADNFDWGKTGKSGGEGETAAHGVDRVSKGGEKDGAGLITVVGQWAMIWGWLQATSGLGGQLNGAT